MVDPLKWTSRHVELLQFHFEESSLAPATALPDVADKKTGACFVRAFRSDRGGKSFGRMRQILSDLDCPFMNGLVFELPLIGLQTSNLKSPAEAKCIFASISSLLEFLIVLFSDTEVTTFSTGDPLCLYSLAVLVSTVNGTNISMVVRVTK